MENYIKDEIKEILENKYNLDMLIKCKGQPYVIEKYKEFNTQLLPATTDEEIITKLRTEGDIDFEEIFKYNVG